MVVAGPEGFVTWTATDPSSEFDPTAPRPQDVAPWGESFPNARNVVCADIIASPADGHVDGTPDAGACDGDRDGDGGVGPADLAFLLGA
jgi:hypothetical protein